MGLKFLPRAGHTVPFAHGNSFGQLARYAGRSFKSRNAPVETLLAHELAAFAASPGSAGSWFADAEPVEVEPDSADAEHFIRHVQRGGMWPGDEATAAACGVDFARLERDDDGEWIAAAKPAPAAAPTPALVIAKKSEPKAAEG